MLGTFIFVQSLHVGLQSGLAKEPLAVPGPSNGAVTFSDAVFLASAEAVGLSQVVKCYSNLRPKF